MYCTRDLYINRFLGSKSNARQFYRVMGALTATPIRIQVWKINETYKSKWYKTLNVIRQLSLIFIKVGLGLSDNKAYLTGTPFINMDWLYSQHG